MDFANDIPVELARAAHAGTSHSPEQRAVSERASYASTLAGDYERLARYANTDEKRAQLVEEFARYRAGYGKRYRAYLSTRSRIVSTMIAGGSNFPARRMQKRNEIADRRTEDLIAFRERALVAIEKVLRPELRPIMAGDANAEERLEDKIAKAERRQAQMKATNAAIRKHAKAGPEAQVAALVELGHHERIARELLKPDFCGRLGFADYEIKNNNANIRRMKERLGQVTEAKATPATELEGAHAKLEDAHAKLEDAPADNRVRLFFPGKPAADVRDRLKGAGFRWTPSLGCWQAYRNHHAMVTARAVAGIEG